MIKNAFLQHLIFQALLREARKEIELKELEIQRLTKEVVELRLYKASLNSPEDKTDSSDACTVREITVGSPQTPCDLLDSDSPVNKASPSTPEKSLPCDVPSSLADSGHFEDDSIHSKDSMRSARLVEASVVVHSGKGEEDAAAFTFSPLETIKPTKEAKKIADLYEMRIEEIHRRHVDELQDMKQKHNDKVSVCVKRIFFLIF